MAIKKATAKKAKTRKPPIKPKAMQFPLDNTKGSMIYDASSRTR